MQCQSCGAEIADKAIVCYRCGAPTAGPAVSPVAPRRGRWTWPVRVLVAVMVAAALWLVRHYWFV